MSGGLLVAMRRWGPPGAQAQEESRGVFPLRYHGGLSTGSVRSFPRLESMFTAFASTSSQTSSIAWASPSSAPSHSSVFQERQKGLVKQQAFAVV